jgi:catechol 2,3-dioxygenase
MAPLPWKGQLAHVALRSADVSAAARFYRDVVGLCGDARPDHALLGWGLGVPVLELRPGEPALDHFAIEVPDPAELSALRDAIGAAGIGVDPCPDPGDRHPDGFRLADPDGRALEFHGAVDRSGEFVADTARRPRRLQHITLATPDAGALVAFYVDVLGFRVSDQMGDVFFWLRCGSEHHTVAIVQSDDERLIDHYSYDLDGWADFRAWCDRLSELGIRVAWGPGRHGPGNNVFVMFDDPDGYHVELSAEMEHYFDDVAAYEPRRWDAVPTSVNLWGGVPAWRSKQVA